MHLRRRINLLLTFFITALLISGLTALPLRWEIVLLYRLLGPGTWMEYLWPGMAAWITFTYQGLTATFDQFPFVQYGTDWLAFAHIVIAIAFIGVLRDPIRNIWVIEFGMIACILVIPVAFVFGDLRGIPLFWRVIDCSFGLVGVVPLWLCRRYILRLAN
jgi:hypothetical protein